MTKKTTATLLFLCIVFLTAALFFVFWKSPLYANAAAQTAHDHTSEWKAYTAGQPMEGGTEQNPAKYYLTEDMTLSDKVEVNGYAVLCLNGHILRGSGNDSVIYVGTGAQLTLCDCNASLPHNYYVDTDGVFVFYDGTLPAEAPEGCEQGTLLGGIVTGGNAGLGGGVFVANNAAFVLESGVIAGNRSDYGGGVDLDEGASFTMTGGAIFGNYASAYGGGVDSFNSEILMQGGLIAQNSGGSGGGVLVYGTFAQQGGVIRDNRASTSGNNVYVQSGNYSMQDGYLDSASGSIDTYPDGSICLSGGYFTSDPFQDTSDPLQDWSEYFTQDAVIVEIDENFGDPAFQQEFPFALYTRGTDVVPSIEAGETCAYDGEPIEAGTDFFVSGLLQDGNYLFSYSDNADGVYQNGLPKGVGTWYVRAAALCKTEQGGAITKTYYPYGQATQIVIEKGTPVYEVPTGLTATYGQTLADIALPVNWEWENAEQSVGNAGTRSAFAVFTPADTENYNTVRAEITFTVEKATPAYEVPTGLTATYGQTLADIALPVNWEWENAEQSVGNAGTRTAFAVFTPADTENYNTVRAEIPFTVEKATPAYEVPAGLTATYGQTLADIALPVNWEWENAEQSVGNAGTRTAYAVFTPADTENYNTVRAEITFTVEKATPAYEVPAGLTATYGQTLADIALPNGWEWENAEQSVGNAGTRSAFAVFTPADTENYNTVRAEITFTVEKATPAYEVPAGLTAIYGQTLADIALPVNWEWENAEQSVGNAGTRTEDAEYTYDGQEKKLEIEGALPAGVSVAYSENRRTDAGELTVTATFTGDAENYEAIAPMSATLRIGKARPEYTVPEGLSAHRGQELCEIALPDGWSWKDGAQTVSGETFSATAVYTPSDTQNYNTVEMLLTIGVESLSQGAVIGISVGSVLGAVLIAYGVLALLYKKGIVHGTFFAKIYPFIR